MIKEMMSLEIVLQLTCELDQGWVGPVLIMVSHGHGSANQANRNSKEDEKRKKNDNRKKIDGRQNANVRIRRERFKRF